MEIDGVDEILLVPISSGGSDAARIGRSERPKFLRQSSGAVGPPHHTLQAPGVAPGRIGLDKEA